MRTLEIRRHCFTKKGDGRGRGSHLSAEGVQQARRIGSTLGPFDAVFTSEIPRTLETALAMGFAVDDTWAGLGEIPLSVWDEIGHQERWTWENPFAHFATIIDRDGPTAALGQLQRELWRDALNHASEAGQVLVVSHGRIIEAGLITCFPDSDFAGWGGPFHHGEGVLLTFDNEAFTNVAFRREPTTASVG